MNPRKPTDITLRNARAAKRRTDRLDARLTALTATVKALAAIVRRLR